MSKEELIKGAQAGGSLVGNGEGEDKDQIIFGILNTIIPKVSRK